MAHADRPGNPGSKTDVDFGTGNTISGTIGDIAGRDIHKETYVYTRSAIEPPAGSTLLQSEVLFAELLLDFYSPHADYFVLPQLVVEREESDLEIPPGFREGFSPEFSPLLRSGPKLAQKVEQRSEMMDYELMLGRQRIYLCAPLGYGKTTVLRMVALEAARRFLEAATAGKAEPNDLSCLRGTQGLRLPVYVNLGLYRQPIPILEFVKRNAWRSTDTTEDDLFPGWKGSIVHDFLDSYLATGSLIVLLDSLDEIGASMLPSVRAELEKMLNGYPGNHFILAGRRSSTAQELRLPQALIEEWNSDQIALCFQRRLGRIDGTTVLNLIRSQNPILFKWLKTPYVSYATALYYGKHRRIPSGIGEVVDKLVASSIQRDTMRGTLSEEKAAELERFLTELAFSSVESSINAGSNSGFVEHTTNSAVTEALVRKSIEMGFIKSSSEGQELHFCNQLVQQYFVGKGLHDIYRNSPDRLSELLTTQLTADSVKQHTRGNLGQKPKNEHEIAWDRPLPPLELSKWYDGLSMLLPILPEPQQIHLLNLIAAATPITVGELLVQLRLDLPADLLDSIRQHLQRIGQGADFPLRARVAALNLLGSIGDPRIITENVKSIPAGMAILGAKSVTRYTHVDSFVLDTYPVTNTQYRQFVAADGYRKRQFWTKAGWQWLRQCGRTEPLYWRDARYSMPNQPVVGVSWYESHAYAEWAGKRLPTEAEWERAATWDSIEQRFRSFPGSDVLFDGIGNLLISEYEYQCCTTPVGAFPLGVSPDGVADLVGNVWEWLSTEYRAYPYDAEDGRESLEGRKRRCLRGGSWGIDQVPGAIGATRHEAHPETSSPFIGFRCARTICLPEPSP